MFHCGLKVGGSTNNDWYIDSGASAHMTRNGDWLKNVRVSPNSEIVVANNYRISMEAIGDIKLSVRGDKSVEMIEIKNVLHVPEIKETWLSSM